MATTNKDLLEKISRGDLASGGILTEKQSEQFLNYVIDESVLKNSARMVLMNEPVQEINKVGIGNRVAKAKAEGIAPNKPADYVSVTTEKIELVSKAIIVPRNITWDTLEDNIERESFEDTVANMIYAQLANDLEELFLQGDTTSADPYLALVDGWLKIMSGAGSLAHDVPLVAPNTTLDKSVFSRLIRSMPTKFRRQTNRLRFFVNSDHVQDYRDTLANRQTGLGDSSVQGADSLRAFGVPVVEVPLLPVGTCILTHADNLIVGMHKKKIRLEKDRDIMAGENLYALHMRVCDQIENTDAIAYTNDLTLAA